MRQFARPVVVVSTCLEFAPCRWDGLMMSSEIVQQLKPFVDFQPVCPEVEIGLGVPRDPIRIVEQRANRRLVQPATDRDVSDEMHGFARTFLDSVKAVDGFILKDQSPSCGIANVKIFANKVKSTPIAKGSGFFAGEVVTRYPYLPIEDEGRLTNFRIREHFLTRLFTLAGFRELKAHAKMKDLVQFHAENKYLLMAYNQKELRLMGRIVANLERLPFGDVMKKYEDHLYRAISRTPRYTSNINVLMHCMGYFRSVIPAKSLPSVAGIQSSLSARERSFFLDQLEQYRLSKVPLSVPISVLRSWIIRFDDEYLAQQTFFEPYPLDLIDITDTGL
jgi:uncharacterized protein YbgA (DUF1722 family)/uncharacterized protein YbbK (DUF523 family)